MCPIPAGIYHRFPVYEYGISIFFFNISKLDVEFICCVPNVSLNIRGSLNKLNYILTTLFYVANSDLLDIASLIIVQLHCYTGSLL